MQKMALGMGGLRRGDRGTRGGWRWLLAWFGCWVAATAAALEPVQADGEALGPDEGWVAIQLLNNFEFRNVRIDRPGFGDTLLRPADAPSGSVRLFRAEAGSYKPKRIELGYAGNLRYYLDVSPRLDFVVEAGVINYPGSVVVESVGGLRFDYQLTNRLGEVYAALERQYPTITAQHPVKFQGEPRDDFVEFFRQARQTLGQQGPLPARADHEATPQARGIPAEALYQSRGIIEMQLSPDGRYIAELSADRTRRGLALIDTGTGDYTVVWEGEEQIESIEWAGVDRLVLQVNQGNNERQAIIQIRHDREPRFHTVAIPLPETTILDVMVHDPDHIAVHWRDPRGGEAFKIFKIDISGERISKSQFRGDRRVPFTLENAYPVLLDRDATPVLAIQRGDDGQRLMVLREREWHAVMSVPVGRLLDPVAVDLAAGTFDALTDIGRDQVELLRLSLADGAVVQALFALPGTDLTGVVRDRDRVVGVRYVELARPRIQYFDPALLREQQALAKLFPQHTVSLLQRSVDGQRSLVLVSGATNPGQYFLFNRDQRSLEPIGHSRPHLNEYRFVAPERFTVQSRDGLEVEALLTRPPGDGPHPLILMPHGGPIGIRDLMVFDREVQYLVSRNLAVLQVNYRGSGGFGRAFEEAGYGNWGQKIEDDIEAALDHALATYPLDAKRVCAMGSSYGGYSALMAMIRAPERFRCAVSVMGVTDLPLMFSSSDWRRLPDSQAIMKKIAGDPERQLQELQAVSPVYRYAELTGPVLLIHGTQDRRVSVDHSERLRMLLTLAGRPPQTLWLEGEDHQMQWVRSNVAAMESAAEFIDRHLALTP